MRIVSVLLVLLQLLVGRSYSQTGMITGAVADKISQEVLPLVNVQIVGTSLGTSTDLEGRFTISGVPFGTYEVRASLVGYEPIVVSDVVVNAGKPTELTIALKRLR